MIHVGMNIPDKLGLFKQVRRVVKPGAIFGIYDVMQLTEGSLSFPVPWSSKAETSFVETPSSYRDQLIAAGFEIVSERNRLVAALEFIARSRGALKPAPRPSSITAALAGNRRPTTCRPCWKQV